MSSLIVLAASIAAVFIVVMVIEWIDRGEDVEHPGYLD
jgi:hypothetical protein